MDFNELKHTWKEANAGQTRVTNDQIEAALRIAPKSNTALGKLKKNYLFEIIVGALEYVIIMGGIGYFIPFPDAMIFMGIVTLLMGIPYLIYFRTYLKIRHIVFTQYSMRETLQKTIDIIDRFVNQWRGNLPRFVLIPFAIAIGMMMGLYIGTGKDDIWEILLNLPQRSWIKMLIVLVVLGSGTIWFAIVMFKRRFKNHFESLKRYLQELEETDHPE